jgi:hypothetical protein
MEPPQNVVVVSKNYASNSGYPCLSQEKRSRIVAPEHSLNTNQAKGAVSWTMPPIASPVSALKRPLSKNLRVPRALRASLFFFSERPF